MKVSRTENVRADVATVWDFAVDVERWPDFMAHITAIRRHGSTPFGLGSSATLRQPGLPQTVWTVDEFRPGVSFRWSGRPLGMSWDADHVLDPISGDNTRLTLTMTASGWLTTLLGPLVKRVTKKALGLECAGFRKACE